MPSNNRTGLKFQKKRNTGFSCVGGQTVPNLLCFSKNSQIALFFASAENGLEKQLVRNLDS